LCDPSKGEVLLGQERYIFVRGSSLSLEFSDVVEKILDEQKEIEHTLRESKRRSMSRIVEEDKEREKEHDEKEEGRRSAESFATNFLFDLASAIGQGDQRDFLNKISNEKAADFSFLSSLGASPSSFSDLLFFGLPAAMAYTGWGSVKFDYSTYSYTSAPSPNLYVLFTVDNSLEASGNLCI